MQQRRKETLTTHVLYSITLHDHSTSLTRSTPPTFIHSAPQHHPHSFEILRKRSAPDCMCHYASSPLFLSINTHLLFQALLNHIVYVLKCTVIIGRSIAPSHTIISASPSQFMSHYSSPFSSYLTDTQLSFICPHSSSRLIPSSVEYLCHLLGSHSPHLRQFMCLLLLASVHAALSRLLLYAPHHAICLRSLQTQGSTPPTPPPPPSRHNTLSVTFNFPFNNSILSNPYHIRSFNT